MLRAVCFDLDGTLFDDRQYVRAGLREAAAVVKSRTGEDVHEQLMTAYFEDGIRKRTFDHVLEAEGLSTDLVPDLVEAYHDNDADLDPYPGASRVLDALGDRYLLGLLTGGRNGNTKLDALGLASHFDETFVAPDHGTTKHEREPYRRLLDALGVSADEAAFVGDRPDLDFPHPNAMGMRTVRVQTGRYADHGATGAAAPDVTVECLEAVPPALESLA